MCLPLSPPVPTGDDSEACLGHREEAMGAVLRHVHGGLLAGEGWWHAGSEQVAGLSDHGVALLRL